MRWRLFYLGLGAYLLGLIVTAPATLVDAGLKRASNGKLGIAEARGTIWSGAGRLEWHDAERRNGVFQDTAWRFLPQSLLLGHATWEIELSQSSNRFPVTISPSQLEVTDARITLPGAVLGLAVPRLAPLELRGEVFLHITHVTIGSGGPLKGDAELLWRGASSTLAPVAPLGDYELRVTSEGAAGHAVLRTLQGPLQLDGKGSWPGGATPAFLATARVPAQLQQQLAPLLRLIAVERGDGRFELRLEQKP
jgi:general secretion pathway protein N